MNPALRAVAPADRRLLLAAEEHRRKSGRWGDWERIDLPNGVAPEGEPGGWPREVRAVYRNRVFAVLERPIPDAVFTLDGPPVMHLAVSSLSGIRPTWHEMQRIKDEIAGEAATAVEVYPPAAEVVDGADMFHIWVIKGGLPFGLRETR